MKAMLHMIHMSTLSDTKSGPDRLLPLHCLAGGPAAARAAPAIARSRLDFPQPEGPTISSDSPGASEKLRPCPQVPNTCPHDQVRPCEIFEVYSILALELASQPGVFSISLSTHLAQLPAAIRSCDTQMFQNKLCFSRCATSYAGPFAGYLFNSCAARTHPY